MLTQLKSEYTKHPRSLFLVVVWIVVIDIFAIISSSFLPWYFRIGIYGEPIHLRYLTAISCFLVFFFFLAISENLYSEKAFNLARHAIFYTLKVAILTFGILLVFAFIFKKTGDFSRLWGSTWLLTLTSYFIVSRFVTARLIHKLSRRGIVSTRVVLVGNRKLLSNAIKLTNKNSFPEIGIAGCIVIEENQQSPIDQSTISIPILGNISQIEQVIEQYKIDDVIIALPWQEKTLLEEIVNTSLRKSVNIYLMPQETPPIKNSGRRHSIGELDLIEIDRKPIDRWKAIIKRIEDVSFSISALALCWPIILLTAIAIKLDSRGPIFFVQPREGFNNKLIKVFKFRSMYFNKQDDLASIQTTAHDNRVTRVGRFIRKTSIDELPQLFNILKGDMSLIGPRPHALGTKAGGRFFADIVKEYAVRHRVKPGLTGWAQVNGLRGETKTEASIQARVEADLYYIRNWSIALDIYILIKTVYVVIFDTKNVY